MIKLGQKAKDKVTGFTGIIIGKCEYLTGCTQYGLTPQSKDGKVNDTQWFDENRIYIIGKGVVLIEAKTPQEKGGPNRDCPR